MRIILHADDFGLNSAVTDGILRCFSHGLLTSTSIMANAPDFERACRLWKELQTISRDALPSCEKRLRLHDAALPFDLGVHLNLTQGRPLTDRAYPASLLDRQGCFCGIGRTFASLAIGAKRHRAAIRAELAAQIEAVLQSGHVVTHLNGHQYVELIPLVGEVVIELAQTYKIPVVRLAYETALSATPSLLSGRGTTRFITAVKRYFARSLSRKISGTSLRTPAYYFGSVHAGRITLPILQTFVESIAQQPSALCEIAFHPGLAVSPEHVRPSTDSWHDPLRELRPQEMELLTSDAIVELLSSRSLKLARLSELAGEL